MRRTSMVWTIWAGTVLLSAGCMADGYEVEAQGHYQARSEAGDHLGCSSQVWSALEAERQGIEQRFAQDLADGDKACAGQCASAWFCCLCDSRCPGRPANCVSRGYAGCATAEGDCQRRERACINRKRKQAAYDYCIAHLIYEEGVAACHDGPSRSAIGHAVNFADYAGQPQVQTCFHADYTFSVDF